MNEMSLKRLHAVGLARLPRDVNGIPDGPDYETFLRTGDLRASKSVKGGKCGVWSGRQHHLAGTDELRGFRRLEGNPVVLSIREGYPIFTPEVLQKAIEGESINRGQVMTIDFVLTLMPYNFGGPLRYLGLSQKKEYLKLTKAGLRRAGREQSSLGRIGWGWDYLRPPKPEESAIDFNHEVLFTWATSPTNESIDVAERIGAELASLVYRTTSAKPLGPLLAMLGRRLGIPENLQLYVFACAYYFGYLRIAHTDKLGLDRPLRLLPAARNFGGAYVRC